MELRFPVRHAKHIFWEVGKYSLFFVKIAGNTSHLLSCSNQYRLTRVIVYWCFSPMSNGSRILKYHLHITTISTNITTCTITIILCYINIFAIFMFICLHVSHFSSFIALLTSVPSADPNRIVLQSVSSWLLTESIIAVWWHHVCQKT